MVDGVGSFYSNRLRTLSPRIRKHIFIGFDVETYGDENKFYSGGLYWEDRGKIRFDYFTDAEKMCKFILARKFKNKYIVATNLDFDLTVLFYNTKYWNKFKILMRQGKIITASYDLGNNNGKIRFIDTANYAFFSVDTLGKIIGERKLDKPYWLGDRKPETPEERLELQTYNMQDCKITRDFSIFFQNGVNSLMGTVQLTIGSTSLKTWRMNYQPCDLIKESFITGDKSIRNFIFEGYYGGRTEVFKRGSFDEVNYYDVNSLYPYVMKNKFPLPQSVKIIDSRNVSFDNIIRYEGVSRCKVNVDNIDKPILPLRHDGKLKFPIGSFEGVWNHIELREAIIMGYDVKPVEQIIYTKSFYPFKNFVDKLYKLRLKYKEENNPFEIVVKLMLNSLYGKFGSKKVEKYKIIDMKTYDGSFNELKKLVGSNDFDVKNGKLIYRKEKEWNGIHSFPILASYVTSYARLHMYEYIKNDDVIYMDTDSIITTRQIKGCDTKLGNMKFEGKYTDCMFIKPKFYCLGDIVKIKGVSRATHDDFITILNGGSVSKMKFSRIKESARRGIQPNTKMIVKKNLSLIDDKRIWEHNDLSTISESKPVEVYL